MAKLTAWDRQRVALRAEITTAACALFVQQGFEETTVDQIVETVGISRRSFFRYFGSKEDVLLGDLSARGDAVARALAERPDGEDPWDALRAALVAAAPETFSDPVADLAIARMMHETPSLRARLFEKRRHWTDALVPLTARHIDAPDAQFTASAIVGAVLSCVDTASDAWIASEGKADMADLYDRAVTAIRTPRRQAAAGEEAAAGQEAAAGKEAAAG
ncbi:TetR/AcrR family transcriptional regulator [Pseudosporangium ferrugineum]|uniref:TetR family transcriptional regulator n=1 Tax=Pseudosporangium ferrugineum TaxID=439699 RepID=A0A2T0RTS4_9ACTN|nr:TetR/AcrR family transcriptional regulator [Pseudosporangium ferrugineum]PRY24609.1 TetR family transcriptional regulator [Pseudosporangium ferrugineum]